MKIFEDCWDKLCTFNCQYGAHLFDGSMAKIYVNHWLDVSGDLRGFFSRRNEEGFVGHCLLVFREVKKFDFTVTPYSKENGKIVLYEPISFHYTGTSEEIINSFEFEGSLHGFPSSVVIEIEAEKFELHILDKNEPAREG